MKELIEHVREYSKLLRESSRWHNSKEILAPILKGDSAVSTENYLYEFYCYIRIIADLRKNYKIQFVPGLGAFKFKFPQAASLKKGKPRFHAFENGQIQFQICAGTKIDCIIDSEDNHPDISFQIGSASEEPTEKDLICIMDAKYIESANSSLPKEQVYKFGIIIDLFELKKQTDKSIKFSTLVDLQGNCLLTNSLGYSNNQDTRFLKRYMIKEVENFAPGKQYKVIF